MNGKKRSRSTRIRVHVPSESLFTFAQKGCSRCPRICNQALAGDPQSIRILLDRVVPCLRPVELATPLELPEGTLAEQAHAVVQAVAVGDIAPSQAAQIITALGGVAKIMETTELLKRIEALEEKQNAN